MCCTRTQVTKYYTTKLKLPRTNHEQRLCCTTLMLSWLNWSQSLQPGSKYLEYSQKRGGCCSGRLMPVVLERVVRHSHASATSRCPLRFDHIVRFIDQSCVLLDDAALHRGKKLSQGQHSFCLSPTISLTCSLHIAECVCFRALKDVGSHCGYISELMSFDRVPSTNLH